MAGEIDVNSRVDQGSTFWFTAVFSKQSSRDRHTELSIADLQGIRVLAVDDKATNRLVVAEQLASYGVRHEETESAMKALALMREAQLAGDPFRIVVTDMQMSGMDGETLGRAIKADPDLNNTILVMMTSLGNRGDAKRLTNIGFAGYLTKPVSQAQLHRCLSAVLGRTSASQGERNTLVTRHTLNEAHRQPCRILLAEDNLINQKVALKLLEKLGCQADIAMNGQEAIYALETLPYDLVFMDVEMPNMDGFEATRRIRSGQTSVLNSQIPIIAMTGHVGPSHRNRCLEAGMNAYISKPISLGMMLQTLTAWCPIIHRFEAEPPSVRKLQIAESDNVLQMLGMSDIPEIPGLDIPLGLLRLAGDHNLYRKLLSQFAETQTGTASAIRQALNENDLISAKRLAHNIKGIAGNLGATSVETAAQSLVEALHQGQEFHINPLLVEFEKRVNDLIQSLQKQPAFISEPTSVTAIQQSIVQPVRPDDLAVVLDNLILPLKTRKPKKCAEAFQALITMPWPKACLEDIDQLDRQIRQYQFSEALILIESLRQKLLAGG